MKALLKFEANWADEFDCEQFMLVEEVENAHKYIEELVGEYNGFGSNQGFESDEISHSNFTITVIDDKMYYDLMKLFGRQFGTGIL